jgi:PHD/YefM family antitoxin component YafN of YafNO toxin-antitoxin module
MMTTAPNYLINPQGEKIAVVLSLGDYEEMLEDIEDLTALVERQNEPLIDHGTVIAELKADGLL